MQSRSLAAALAAAALLAPAAAQAAAPSNVTIRVEGVSRTVLPKSAVRTTAALVNKDGKDGHDCEGTTAAGALEIATQGNWGGTYFSGLGWSVERVFEYELAFDKTASRDYYFAYWRNYEFQNVGICSDVQEGDDLLLVPDCFGDCGHAQPLRLQVPAAATAGTPVEARVTEYTVTDNPDYSGTSASHPAVGATVTVGETTATTDAQGIARVTLPTRGPQALRATKAGFVPSASETVCNTDGADGFCGTSKPGETPKPVAPCEHAGDDGRCGTRDRTPPVARLLGITDKQVFARGTAPRELRGAVTADPSGLFAVKLEITRRYRGRCQYFSARKDRFVNARCGRSFPFRIGDRQDWSYLLPEALAPGRYVIDVIAIDKAFNRLGRARGVNRITFTVSG
jgi:hypothetical protein